MEKQRDRADKAAVQSTELNKLPAEDETSNTQLSAETAAEVFQNDTSASENESLK